jgi:hypothetical protein
MSTSKPDVPKPSTGDHLNALARAGIGTIPIVGSVAVELFNAVVAPPLERRRDQWRESVGKRIQKLEESYQILPESLANNESFIDTVFQATQAALRTHHEDKILALSNAVTNSALQTAPNQSLQQLFIRWVDELTVDHLRFLRLFSDPRGWFVQHNVQPPEFSISGSLFQLLEYSLQDLASNPQLCELIAIDLSNRKLFNGSLNGMMTANGVLAKRSTELGDQFISYISAPK